ncbi:Cna B-type domain-containing protein [Actinotignum schaalii]|uniref:Cna B-type domain-containing protein n=1 Tax=Actinotignum schaalii TaxID=59505 RepID=UPI0004026CBC|nr:Cna B-type domain-containing protein [Actinotignum schaalii]WQN45291.1 Cna B-type domain-containing protein [Actinotignum schaalii]
MVRKLSGALSALIIGLLAVIAPLPAALGEPGEVTPSTWDELITTASQSGDVSATLSHKLTLSADSPVLRVPAGTQLTLTGSGDVAGANLPAIQVDKGGSLTLAGPSFTKAQFVVEGTLTVSAGSIHDTALTGPVIFVKGGDLNISGTADFSKNSSAPQDGTLGPSGVVAKKYAPITAYGGSITVSGGTLTENSGLQLGGAIGVWGSAEQPAKLVISGGTLSKNTVSHPRFRGYGGAVFTEGATVELSGGTLSENATEIGGAMALMQSPFTMSGGEIRGNSNGEFAGAGGGIFTSGGDVHITGGTVADNSASGFGGGLNIQNATASITGLTVTGNTALKSGGGMAFGGTTKAVINAALIRDNTAQGFYGGGGIYNDDGSTLTVHNALVRNNDIRDAFLIGVGGHPISAQGGGVWNCPTGRTTLHITRGVAIFDNSAPDIGKDKKYKGAGDDFLSVSEHDYGSATPTKGKPVVVTERMLGGSPRVWFQDGSVYSIRSNWEPEKQLPRYQEGGQNTPVPFGQPINDNKAFKSVPSAEAKALAEVLASVIVENNHATTEGISGGGIANNGELIFGEDDIWTLRVTKAWEGDDAATRPESITLDVLVGGHKLQEITLTAAQQWTAEIANFPNPATLIDAATGRQLPIEFREHGAESSPYTLRTTATTADDGAKLYTVALTNTMSTEVSVAKKWNDDAAPAGLRPDKVTVELLDAGQPVGQSLELSAANGWTGAFTDLPVYREGRKAVYSVREVQVPGYTSVISGDATNGYVITNTHTPPPPTTEPPAPPTTPPTTEPPAPPTTPPCPPTTEPPTPPTTPPTPSVPPTTEPPVPPTTPPAPPTTPPSVPPTVPPSMPPTTPPTVPPSTPPVTPPSTPPANPPRIVRTGSDARSGAAFAATALVAGLGILAWRRIRTER